MHGVIGKLISYVQQDEQRRRQAYRQTQHVYDCIASLTGDAAEGEKKIIEYHGAQV